MFVLVSENICTICLENFHTEYGKCVATVPLFSETSKKEFSYVSCEKPVILMELFLESRIVVIQDGEDGKRSVHKKCARKIANCYRMFMELWEALAGGKAFNEAKESTPQTPSSASPRGSIPVQGQRSLTEVTPKAKWQKKSTCENEAEGALRRPSTKRTLFSDQHSELDIKITSPEQA